MGEGQFIVTFVCIVVLAMKYPAPTEMAAVQARMVAATDVFRVNMLVTTVGSQLS